MIRNSLRFTCSLFKKEITIEFLSMNNRKRVTETIEILLSNSCACWFGIATVFCALHSPQQTNYMRSITIFHMNVPGIKIIFFFRVCVLISGSHRKKKIHRIGGTHRMRMNTVWKILNQTDDYLHIFLFVVHFFWKLIRLA